VVVGTPAEVLDEVSELFGSRARGLLALNLAKAWLSEVPLSASRLAWHLDAPRVRGYAEALGGAPWGAVLRNASRAWEYMVEHYSGFHYALARLRYPGLEGLWRQARAALERVLGEQP